MDKPGDEIPDFIPDDFAIDAAPKEPTAEERAAKMARIARENDRLQKAGQIADGSGKPAYRRASQSRALGGYRRCGRHPDRRCCAFGRLRPVPDRLSASPSPGRLPA